MQPEAPALLWDAGRVVAFRNILAHGYAVVDDEIVWQLATQRLPELAKVVATLSDDLT